VEKSDLKSKPTEQKTLLDRLSKSSSPAAAVVGAVTSFAAALGSRPESKAAANPDSPLVQLALSGNASAPAPAPRELKLRYGHASTLVGRNSSRPFLHSLSGIAISRGGNVYVLGDGEVRVFEAQGALIRTWKAPQNALCLSIDSEERVYVGSIGRVDIFDKQGKPAGGFAAGTQSKPAHVTAVKAYGSDILVADAAARLIFRYSQSGKQTGEIGTKNKTRSFMLPNRWLDMDVDAHGLIRATDSGRHQVTSWLLDGTPAASFGKFGQQNLEDFVGCCNPVNLAIGPDGNIVTAEKVIPRVKVYDSSGTLLGIIGPEHFDLKCVHLHLAVDSKGRIYVGDPVRLEVQIFSPETGEKL
jgi:sugar lactone lactonase YvrE